MRVRGGGRCVFGVVGPCRILLPGGRIMCCWELNSLGSLTVERESRVNGPVACGVGVCGGLFVICIVVASIFVLYCFLCFV